MLVYDHNKLKKCKTMNEPAILFLLWRFCQIKKINIRIYEEIKIRSDVTENMFKVLVLIFSTNKAECK